MKTLINPKTGEGIETNLTLFQCFYLLNNNTDNPFIQETCDLYKVNPRLSPAREFWFHKHAMERAGLERPERPED